MRKLFQFFINVDIVDVLIATIIPISVLMIASFFINVSFNNKFSINLVNVINFLVMILFSILIPKLLLFTFTIIIDLAKIKHYAKLLSFGLNHSTKIYTLIFLLVPISLIVSTAGFVKDTARDNAVYYNYLEEK